MMRWKVYKKNNETINQFDQKQEVLRPYVSMQILMLSWALE